MKTTWILLFSLCALSLDIVSAQQTLNVDSISAPANLDNIHNQKIASDSLSTTFLVFIKNNVRLHKHVAHTENVVVLEGEAEMILGDKTLKIKKGDWIFIPKNTAHAVKTTSTIPLKVLSIQSPNFDGSDRVILEKY